MSDYENTSPTQPENSSDNASLSEQEAPKTAFAALIESLSEQQSQPEDSPGDNASQSTAHPSIPEDIEAYTKKRREDAARLEAERQSILNELHELAYAEAASLNYLPKTITSVKKPSHLFPKLLLVFLVIFISLFLFTAQRVFGKGWIKNMINKSGNFQSFTIPLAEHPETEERYLQPDGRYTVEGVYAAVSDSIVTIETFVDDTIFAAFGQGSGIVMTEDGYIITNAHVIEKAQLAIVVRLRSGEEYNATVIGSDVKSDLAIIKINANDLTPARFGNSDSVVMGEQVVAIGSPAGMESSVTTGIVSGLNRMIKVDTDNISMNCIQIDAAINPGNSGGALLNMWGEVVGITSSKMEAMAYDNIGFAISMNAAKPILEELIESGSVLGRPKVGISFYEISDSTALVYGIPAGLHIAAVSPDCDIANTDLAPDDIITEMNGVKVRSADDVYAIIFKLHPGDQVTAKVLRENEDGEWDEFEISFKLMEDTSGAIQSEEDIEEVPAE